jgi:hypothetical protein
MRIRWITVVISVLIVVFGWVGSQTLMRVDQDLRVIYTEYTLAATDLGHLNGELIRYRTSVIRAIETDSKKEFLRIVASLPEKRNRIDKAIERFVAATDDASADRSLDARELSEVKAVQERIASYMASSHHALRLMEEGWNVASTIEAQRLQDAAKQYLAEDAGSKYMSVTVELDRLLEVVSVIAGDVKKEADATLRFVTVALICASLTLSAIVITLR